MPNLDLIKLRAVEPTDADFMYEIENDPLCWRYSDTVAPLSRRIIRDYALNYDADPFSARQLRLIASICSNNGNEQIGVVDLYDIDPVHRRAFIGIYILSPFRHMGVGTVVLRRLEEYARNVISLRLLAAKVEHTNAASLGLFEKAGFEVKARIPEWFSLPDATCSDLLLLTKRIRH